MDSSPHSPVGDHESLATLEQSTGRIPPDVALEPVLERYITIDEIGRGGMGRVLRAYDPTLQREVALKEVSADKVGSDAAQRLVDEARAMAKLSHPNVVAVYDVTVFDGRMVVVMEYVPGITLGAWVREHDRAWPDVLARFVAAGRGLAAAHAAGILHRDFKPSNVLVDGSSTKVTDFGLALLHRDDASGSWSSRSGTDLPPSTRVANATQTGVVLGTPRYMSPEQHHAEPLTAASDQYSFCVALWEALCGTPPFRSVGHGRQKLKGPPPWPLQTIPTRIVRAIQRGLAPEPERRWPSLDRLLAALEGSASTKHRWWRIGAGAAAAAAALVGLQSADDEQCGGAEEALGEAWSPARREAVREAILAVPLPYVERAWTHAARTLDRHAEQWKRLHRSACLDTTVRGEVSTEVLDRKMACLSRARIDLDAVTTLLARADQDVVRNASEVLASLQAVDRCGDAEALAAAVLPPAANEADAVEYARTRLATSAVQRAAGRYVAAVESLEQAEGALADVAYRPVHAELALSRGLVLERMGRYREAEQALRQALAISLRTRQREDSHKAASMLLLVVGERLGRMHEGLAFRTIATGMAADDPVLVATTLEQEAVVLAALGRVEASENILRRALALRIETQGVEDPAVAAIRTSLADTLDYLGRYPEAEVEYRAALDTVRRLAGAEHPDLRIIRNNLANVVRNQGRYDEAEREFRAIIESYDRTGFGDHDDAAIARTNLALLLDTQGRHAEAETEYRTALDVVRRRYGDDNPLVATTYSNLGFSLAAQKRWVESETYYRRGLEIRLRILGPDHPSVGLSRHNIGQVLRDRGDFDSAEVEFRAALGIIRPVLGDSHPHVAVARHSLADLLGLRGRPAEAVPLAEAALAARMAPGTPDAARASTQYLVARMLWARGRVEDRPRALELARSSLETLSRLPAPHSDLATQVADWLEAR